ncbi:MAG: hypothetical protein CL536_01655 [Alcaligenaceae bacterium]|nr:hypothetical protein [Alcaligenaceae bacterium]
MEKSELEEEWYGLKFDVRRAVRYHQRRRAFFDVLDRGGNLLSLVFGSAAIYGILQDNFRPLAITSAAIVTIWSSVNLVVGSAQKARLHYDLARRFIQLERNLLCEPNEEQYHKVYDERLSIEAEEPPTLKVLDAICYNDTVKAQGLPKERMVENITGWQRFCAHFFDWDFDKLIPPKS